MIATRQFWVAKSGSSLEEYEDAFAVCQDTGLYAIADGATESSFSKEWARLLVTGFVTNYSCLRRPTTGRNRGDNLLRWLSPLQKAWYDGINWSKLPWFAEEKARKGSFASFAGLRIEYIDLPCRQGRWSAIAIGDCALFLVRDDSLKVAFPLTRSEEFGSHPIMLSSNPIMNHLILSDIRVKRGNYRTGDLFLLCSDALAKWFLQQSEDGEKPWSVLRNLSGQADFERFAMKLRTEGSVRNDDLTLVTLNIA